MYACKGCPDVAVVLMVWLSPWQGARDEVELFVGGESKMYAVCVCGCPWAVSMLLTWAAFNLHPNRYIDQLVELARYLGFDGWLLNVEVSLPRPGCTELLIEAVCHVLPSSSRVLWITVGCFTRWPPSLLPCMLRCRDLWSCGTTL